MSSDAELVGRAQSGDASAYEVLMRRHFEAAFITARSLTNVVEDAEDACQEAFARAYFRLEECGQPESFRGWVLQIVRYQAMNIRRYQALRAAQSLDAASGIHAVSDNNATDFSDESRRLRRALDSLPHIQRTVAVHHEIDGWTHSQIARKTGLSVLMSRRHLSDARAKLRKQLGDLLPEEREHE
ncbi:MAG: RNA polymerase sigma factor [Gemmatimonadaceae bacterium]